MNIIIIIIFIIITYSGEEVIEHEWMYVVVCGSGDIWNPYDMPDTRYELVV